MVSQSGIPEPSSGEYEARKVRYTRRIVPHIGHRSHLCDMVERGEVPLKRMMFLAQDPKFICRKCGRVAHNEDNLCEPVPLTRVG